MPPLALRRHVTTVLHALTPNQGPSPGGGTILSVVMGKMSGFANFNTFYATTRPNGGPNHGVRKTDGDIGVGTPLGQPSSTWPELFFPTGTTYGVGAAVATYGYVYTAKVGAHHRTTQQWVDTSTNADGQASWDRNITG